MGQPHRERGGVRVHRRVQPPTTTWRRRSTPHVIATAGLTDPRVTWWEPAKWVAKLRATKTGDRLLLLHTNMEAGHGGAAGRFDRLKETALVYAFVLHVFGIGTGVTDRRRRFA